MGKRVIIGQTLGSTTGGGPQGDLHGERYDKEFFEDIIRSMPARQPLQQHHDFSHPPIGYLSNFRLVEDSEPGHWRLLCDVEYDDSFELPDIGGGFSWSATRPVISREHAIAAVFLPYPYYNDEKAMLAIAEADDRISIGKWIKKGLSVAEVALLVSLTNLVLGPWWKKTYDEKVHPHIENAINALRGLLTPGSRVDMVQLVSTMYYAGTVEAFFVPDEIATGAGYAKVAVKEALEAMYQLIEDDWKSTSREIKRVVFAYDASMATYQATVVTYRDGSYRVIAAVQQPALLEAHVPPAKGEH